MGLSTMPENTIKTENYQIIEKNRNKDLDIWILEQKVEKLESIVEHLQELSKMNVASSCEDLALYGVNKSGYYMVDYDEHNQNAPPTNVFCRFDGDGSIFTEIIHNSQGNIVDLDQNTCLVSRIPT